MGPTADGWFAIVDKRDADGALLEEALQAVAQLARRIDPRAHVVGRVKTRQSRLDKLQTTSTSRAHLDSIGIRVLVHEPSQCYRVKTELKRAFETIDGEDDDYIKEPKPNGYRSLHLTLLSGGGRPVEVQIRTHGMHAVAERGSAAHGRYKQKAARLARERAKTTRFRRFLRHVVRDRSDEEALRRWETDGGR